MGGPDTSRQTFNADWRVAKASGDIKNRAARTSSDLCAELIEHVKNGSVTEKDHLVPFIIEFFKNNRFWLVLLNLFEHDADKDVIASQYVFSQVLLDLVAKHSSRNDHDHNQRVLQADTILRAFMADVELLPIFKNQAEQNKNNRKTKAKKGKQKSS